MNESCKHLFGKRLASLDYGRKRTGFAVCDEFHITVSPRKIFDVYSETFFEELRNEIQKEKIAAIILGIPLRTDGVETEIIKEIRSLKEEIEKHCEVEVILFDEAFSSRRATETMLAIGKKKKNRSKKGNKDTIAAAVILREFLETELC